MKRYFFHTCIIAIVMNVVSQTSIANSQRMDERFGIYGGLLEPVYSAFGINMAYNFTDYLRVSAGYGGGYGLHTYGGLVHFLVPGWSFSPKIAFGVSRVESRRGFAGLTGTKYYGTAQVGFDWQLEDGFYIGAGLAYLNIGIFF